LRSIRLSYCCISLRMEKMLLRKETMLQTLTILHLKSSCMLACCVQMKLLCKYVVLRLLKSLRNPISQGRPRSYFETAFVLSLRNVYIIPLPLWVSHSTRTVHCSTLSLFLRYLGKRRFRGESEKEKKERRLSLGTRPSMDEASVATSSQLKRKDLSYTERPFRKAKTHDDEIEQHRTQKRLQRWLHKKLHKKLRSRLIFLLLFRCPPNKIG